MLPKNLKFLEGWRLCADTNINLAPATCHPLKTINRGPSFPLSPRSHLEPGVELLAAHCGPVAPITALHAAESLRALFRTALAHHPECLVCVYVGAGVRCIHP